MTLWRFAMSPVYLSCLLCILCLTLMVVVHDINVILKLIFRSYIWRAHLYFTADVNSRDSCSTLIWVINFWQRNMWRSLLSVVDINGVMGCQNLTTLCGFNALLVIPCRLTTGVLSDEGVVSLETPAQTPFGLQYIIRYRLWSENAYPLWVQCPWDISLKPAPLDVRLSTAAVAQNSVGRLIPGR